MDTINIPELQAEVRASGALYWNTGASFSMKVNWLTTPNISEGYTKVEVSLNVVGASVSGICKEGSHITINGNKSSFYNKSLSFGGVAGTEYLIHYHSVNVYHTGAVSVPISGAWQWDGYIWINGDYSGTFNTVSGSSSISCSALLTAPTAPTWCTHTGNFDNGFSTAVSWGGATGTIDKYIVQVRFWNKDTGYGGWWKVGETNGSTTTFNIGHAGVSNDGLQARVYAQNSAGDSAAKEGETVYHEGIKYYNNGWKISNVKVWNGSSWTKGYARVWNGSSWVRP